MRSRLGRDRVGVFDGTKAKATVKQFVNSRIHQVLIIGYEKLRTVMCVHPRIQPSGRRKLISPQIGARVLQVSDSSYPEHQHVR
jgi:hypothetical protein